MVEQIDRGALKAETRQMLRGAEVNPKAFVALYMGLALVLVLVDSIAGSSSTATFLNPLGLFVSILIGLLTQVLAVGLILYCMAIRKGRQAGFLTIFDGFSFAGRIIGLIVVEYFFVMLWTLLFIIPGIVAAYRYRFAYFNLCENPSLGCMEALDMSKQQTQGYKMQLLCLNLSYFGWALLASLPTGILSAVQTQQRIYSIANTGSDALDVAGTTVLSSVIIIAVCGLWSLLIALFYLPSYQCAEIGYYEVAKRTSGITPLPPDLPVDGIDSGSGNSLF